MSVCEGHRCLLSRDSLGAHRQMHAYFYFLLCFCRRVIESCTHVPIFSLHRTVVRDCYGLLRRPRFLIFHLMELHSRPLLRGVSPALALPNSAAVIRPVHMSSRHVRVSLGLIPGGGSAGSNVMCVWNIYRSFQTALP